MGKNVEHQETDLFTSSSLDQILRLREVIIAEGDNDPNFGFIWLLVHPLPDGGGKITISNEFGGRISKVKFEAIKAFCTKNAHKYPEQEWLDKRQEEEDRRVALFSAIRKKNELFQPEIIDAPETSKIEAVGRQ